MRRRETICTVLAAMALTMAPSACDSQPETVVDSDVPQIVGLESRHASAINREGDTLVGGRFLYRGEVRDSGEIARDTERLFNQYGWKTTRSEIGPVGAKLTFTKDSRTVDVDVKANLLNPAMGSGVITVSRDSAGAAPSTPPSSPGTPPASSTPAAGAAPSSTPSQ